MNSVVKRSPMSVVMRMKMSMKPDPAHHTPGGMMVDRVI
jgi:hypothetical protein